MILERRGDVHHELVNVMAPEFTPDGKTLVMILADHDWRQPYAFDVASKQLRRLVSGDFEAYRLLGFTPDSKTLFVASNKGDLASMNLWRVDMASGQMTALGATPDYHRNGVVSRSGQWLAANAWQYGFLLRYPSGLTPITGYAFEPWHYRFIGTELAAEMHLTGVQTLEEFFGLPAAPDYQ
jgi:Tol biopolymer transport system component